MPRDARSPFSPGQPVPFEFFVGRLREIKRLEARAAKSAANGRPEVEFLVGERGIGKSSLASVVRLLAERQHQALGVHTFLSGALSLEDMVRAVFDRLLKATVDTSLFDRLKDLFGKYVRKVGLFSLSLEFAPPPDELGSLVRNFAHALRGVLDRLKGDKKLLVLVLDDLNGLAYQAPFANWLKSLVDEMATADTPFPVFLLLVGIEERRQALIEQQPSLDRVLDPVDIHPWSPEEAREFYSQAFSKVGIALEPQALDALTHYAGGLPVLAHEIGDAAFNLDTDNRIDAKDATTAIRTAADVVGRKYLQPKVIERSEKQALPQHSDQAGKGSSRLPLSAR